MIEHYGPVILAALTLFGGLFWKVMAMHRAMVDRADLEDAKSKIYERVNQVDQRVTKVEDNSRNEMRNIRDDLHDLSSKVSRILGILENKQ